MSDTVLLKEKFSLLMKVRGEEDIKTMDAGLKYLSSAINDDSANLEELFQFAIKCLKIKKKLGNDYDDWLSALYNLIEKIKKIHYSEKKYFDMYMLAATDYSLRNAMYYVGQCYYYGKGVLLDYFEAYKWFEKAKGRGCPVDQILEEDCCYKIGNCYLNGLQVKKDSSEAFNWVKKAADSGHAKAQNTLGELLLSGIGTLKNEEAAVAMFKKSSLQGYAEAQYNLANCLILGTGINQDYFEATKWLEKASEQGLSVARDKLSEVYYEIGNSCFSSNSTFGQLSDAVIWYEKAMEHGYSKVNENYSKCCACLGDYYVSNIVEEKNYQKAIEWYEKALSLGNNDVKVKLANNYWILGNSVLSKGNNTVDYKKSAYYFERAAQLGMLEAQDSIGDYYYFGHGLKKDLNAAARWYLGAAEQGYVQSQRKIGDCFSNGKGVKKDKAKAFEWYKKAAEQGDSEAQFSLGICFRDGKGTAVDEKKAYKWLKCAANHGNMYAQECLGELYLLGKGVEKNNERAIECFVLSANSGNLSSQIKLGDIFYGETEIESDYQQAAEWYMKAASKGDAHCQFRLGLMYEEGRGVEKNKSKAIEYYSKASDQGNTDASRRLAQINDDTHFKKLLPYNVAFSIVLVALSFLSVFQFRNYFLAGGFAFSLFTVVFNYSLIKNRKIDIFLFLWIIATFVVRLSLGPLYSQSYLVISVTQFVVALFDLFFTISIGHDSDRSDVVLLICLSLLIVFFLVFGLQLSWTVWQCIIAILSGSLITGLIIYLISKEICSFLIPLLIIIISSCLNYLFYFLFGGQYFILFRIISIFMIISSGFYTFKCFDEYEDGFKIAGIVVLIVNLIATIVFWIIISGIGKENAVEMVETIQNSITTSERTSRTRNTSQWWKWPIGVIGAILLLLLCIAPNVASIFNPVLFFLSDSLLRKFGYPGGFDIFFKCFTIGFAISSLIIVLNKEDAKIWARILSFLLLFYCMTIIIDFPKYMIYTTS